MNKTLNPAPVDPQLQAAIVWAASSECYNELATDIARKASAKWTLSDRQKEVVVKIHAGYLTRAAEKQARLDAGIKAPTGRVTVVGTIMKIVDETTDYGPVRKLYLDLKDGSKVRGNAPRFSNPVAGQVVEFTATFSPSQRDPSMGWFSRAVNWTTVKAATA